MTAIVLGIKSEQIHATSDGRPATNGIHFINVGNMFILWRKYPPKMAGESRGINRRADKREAAAATATVCALVPRHDGRFRARWLTLGDR